MLRARVAAPPADSAANDALVRLLAKALRIAPSRVTLVSGANSRTKLLDVAGVDGADLRARLAP